MHSQICQIIVEREETKPTSPGESKGAAEYTNAQESKSLMPGGVGKERWLEHVRYTSAWS